MSEFFFEFTPPSFPELAWDESSELYRHYGTLPVGHTIYKEGDTWHTLSQGYEEETLANADIVYRGGRVYLITLAEYVELFIAGFVPLVGIGFYPGAYPGPITFPPPDDPSIPPSEAPFAYPGDDTYPGDDLHPEAD